MEVEEIKLSCVGSVVLFVALSSLIAFLIKTIWNVVMPVIGLPVINMWQAFLVLFIGFSPILLKALDKS
jgi:hypothetical protein